MVKTVPAGEGVGYGHTFRASQDTDVALVPVGYADGVFRLLGNRGQGVDRRTILPDGRQGIDGFVRGRRRTDCRVSAGDTVTLIGRDGASRVSAEDVAGWAETINYEITCKLSTARGRHLFVDDARLIATGCQGATG